MKRFNRALRHHNTWCHVVSVNSVVASINRIQKVHRNVSELDWKLAVGHQVLGELEISLPQFLLQEERQLLVGLVHVDLNLAADERTFVCVASIVADVHQRLGEVLGEVDHAHHFALPSVGVRVVEVLVEVLDGDGVVDLVDEAARNFMQITGVVVHVGSDEGRVGAIFVAVHLIINDGDVEPDGIPADGHVKANKLEDREEQEKNHSAGKKKSF